MDGRGTIITKAELAKKAVKYRSNKGIGIYPSYAKTRLMIKCYFDGACEPKNPYGNMGVGAYVEINNVRVFSFSEYIPESKQNSNNVAEYLGLEKILQWVKSNAETILENKILVFGDSRLVINQMSGKWRIKHGIYAPHAHRCKDLAKSIKKEFVFNWIPREINQQADELSKASLLKNKVEFKLQPNEQA